jgi:extracellular factor (EF) 3-hydroxypalmitic acid methyl ester biosynthesis protein
MELTATRAGENSDRWVTFEHGQGSEIGKLMHLTRYAAVFETYAPPGLLQMSQSLGQFMILIRERSVYSGRAVVHRLINTGAAAVCEVSLDDTWVDREKGSLETLATDFDGFFEGWKRSYQVLPEYKVVLSDLHTFLWDLRGWLDQIGVGFESLQESEREALHGRIVQELAPRVRGALDSMIERFEQLTDGLSAAARPAHKSFLQRQLHPLLLSAPFARRAYTKPLGYAGDYEMVRMIAGEPCVGPTLFAKLLNCWLLGQAPAQAHRNRLAVLVKHLRGESVRISRCGRSPRFLSLGCGPALEVARFLEEPLMGLEPDVTLVDFNEETLDFAASTLAEICRRRGRHATVHPVRKSVTHLVKEGLRARGQVIRGGCDLVYCAGLFDYLTDEVCRLLIRVLYDLLLPGGLLFLTNADASLNASRSFRNSMDFMLDWNLVFRTGRNFEKLCVEALGEEIERRVESDLTGVNNFLLIRKPGLEASGP